MRAGFNCFSGLVQVLAASQEEEGVGEATSERGRRREQAVRHQANSVSTCQTAGRLHQPEERRQPGPEAAAQVPLVAQPTPSVRPE